MSALWECVSLGWQDGQSPARRLAVVKPILDTELRT
jgi:hypothetical protein